MRKLWLHMYTYIYIYIRIFRKYWGKNGRYDDRMEHTWVILGICVLGDVFWINNSHGEIMGSITG